MNKFKSITFTFY